MIDASPRMRDDRRYAAAFALLDARIARIPLEPPPEWKAALPRSSTRAWHLVLPLILTLGAGHLLAVEPSGPAPAPPAPPPAPAPIPAAATPVPVPAAARQLVVAPPHAAPVAPGLAPEVPPEPSPSSAPPAPPPVRDELAAELTAYEGARDALGRDPAAGLAAVTAYRARFPQGRLLPEFLLLEVRAHAGLGEWERVVALAADRDEVELRSLYAAGLAEVGRCDEARKVARSLPRGPASDVRARCSD